LAGVSAIHFRARSALAPAGQPFRDPRFSTSDRSRWWGEGYPLTVDWIYPYLTTADKAAIRTVFLRWIDETAGRADCCGDPRGVLKATRLLDSRLRLRSGEIVAAARRDKPDELGRLIRMWQLKSSQTVESQKVTIPSPSLLGIIAGTNRWYLLLANLEGADLLNVRDFVRRRHAEDAEIAGALVDLVDNRLDVGKLIVDGC
jgi:hypothetical protein